MLLPLANTLLSMYGIICLVLWITPAKSIVDAEEILMVAAQHEQIQNGVHKSCSSVE